MRSKCLLLILGLCLYNSVSLFAQARTDLWLQQLLQSNASPQLQRILAQPDTFQYQVIYTQINRDKKNRPHFTHFFLNVDRNRYFNPASTVKLPTALAAMEKINRLKSKGIDKQTSMLTDSAYSKQTCVTQDTSSINGLPSIAHYIKKIFLVSDNDAYNRLYEFTGQQTLNESLWKKGYKDVRITRRFVPMTPEENRHTNPVRFVKDGNVVYSQPEGYSTVKFNFSKPIHIGKAHYNWQEELIQQPMDFTEHNNLPLQDLQQIVQSVLFPASVAKKQRFRLTDDDYRLLYHYMSALPSESRFPAYDTTEFFNSYTKFLFKAGKGAIPANLRIFNKTGWSYGFLTDASYVADFENGVEFMLSAVIYVNADGILNDGKYEYEQQGYPFFKELGNIIYQHELKRERKYRPDLSRFVFQPY